MSAEPEVPDQAAPGLSWIRKIGLVLLFVVCASLGWLGLFQYGPAYGIGGALVGIGLYRIIARFPCRTLFQDGLWIWLVFACLAAMASSVGNWFYLAGK